MPCSISEKYVDLLNDTTFIYKEIRAILNLNKRTSIFTVTVTYYGFSQMYRCGLWQLSSFQVKPLAINSRQFSSPPELLGEKWLCGMSGDTTDSSFIHFHTPSILRSSAPIQKSAKIILYEILFNILFNR